MLLPILFVCIQHLPRNLVGKLASAGVGHHRIPHYIIDLELS